MQVDAGKKTREATFGILGEWLNDNGGREQQSMGGTSREEDGEKVQGIRLAFVKKRGPVGIVQRSGQIQPVL